VEETLNCEDPVPTIFKLGDASCQCNDAAHAGALKYANGKVYLCVGTEWKTFQLLGEYGTDSANPGISCKDILNKARKQLSNGVFWIRLQGNQQALPVYCDMAAGGWTMIFKAVSGVDRRVWDLYNSAEASAEFVTAALDITNQHRDHYKNRVVMHWQSFSPSQAKVIVYEGGVNKKELFFNAAGTDKLNWFSEGKLVSSSWTDIKTEETNYFSIEGDGPRNFLINRNYGGCDVDAGWLVAGAGIHCSWETSAAHKNKVLYSKKSTYTNWNSNDVGIGDVLAVFLQ